MQEQSNHIYRLRPYYRNVGIACATLFLCAWIGSVLAAFFNVDGSFARPGIAIAFFSVGWGSFTFLGVWLILAYVRERLFLDEDAICQVGVLRMTTISFSEMPDLRWRRFPRGGSVVLTGFSSTIKIYFDNFTNAERTEIIAYLRARIDDERQTGWDDLHERFVELSPDRVRRQRSAKRIVILCLFGCAIAFAVLWLSGCGVRFLVLAIVNILAGAWFASGIRRTENGI